MQYPDSLNNLEETFFRIIESFTCRQTGTDAGFGF